MERIQRYDEIRVVEGMKWIGRVEVELDGLLVWIDVERHLLEE